MTRTRSKLCWFLNRCHKFPLVSSGLPIDLPAIVWQADAATLAFQSVEGDAQATMGHPASYWLSHREFFEERIHPDDRAAIMALYVSVIEAGGEASAEYRTAAGSVWCRETIRVAGTTITGVITNITARKQYGTATSLCWTI